MTKEARNVVNEHICHLGNLNPEVQMLSGTYLYKVGALGANPSLTPTHFFKGTLLEEQLRACSHHIVKLYVIIHNKVCFITYECINSL